MVLSSASSSDDGSDIEWVGPVNNTIIDIDDIVSEVSTIAAQITTASNTTSTGENSTSGNSNGSSSNRNETSENIEQAGSSQMTTKSSTTSATTLNLSGDDSDEEEITNYLHRKPQATAEEIIRGRTGLSPKSNSNSNENNNAENAECSEDNTDRTVIVAPNSQINAAASAATNSSQNELPSTSQAATVINSVGAENNITTPKIEPNSQPSQDEIINADSDSDSDECLFVCAKKPPHLRTPEYVELNSDSDSDVVFVSSEACQTVKTENTISNSSHLEKSNVIVSAFSAQNSAAADAATQCESSTNIFVSNSRRKRSGNTQNNSNATATITYSGQNTSSNPYEPKPSTSVVQWLIQTPTDHSQHVSQIQNQLRNQALNLSYCASRPPRITTTLKISRGKRIYESSTSEESGDEPSTDPGVSSPSISSKSGSSPSDHDEDYVPKSRTTLKRVSNNDGPSLMPQKKRFRRRAVAVHKQEKMTRSKRIAANKSKRNLATRLRNRRFSTTSTSTQDDDENDEDEDDSDDE